MFHSYSERKNQKVLAFNIVHFANIEISAAPQFQNLISAVIRYLKSHACFCCQTSLLQQEVLKFYDICIRWSFPKTEMKEKFLNLENRSFGMSVFLHSKF